MTTAAPVEARSLSSLTTLASNPPTYPRNPTQQPLEPLVLYIVRVPGSRDVFLTPLKPPTKSSISAEAIHASLYYLHISTPDDDAVLHSFEEEKLRQQSARAEAAPPEAIHRKPLPPSPHDNAYASGRPEPPPKSYPYYQPPSQGPGRDSQVARKAARALHMRLGIRSDGDGQVRRKPPMGPRPFHSRLQSVDGSSIEQKPVGADEGGGEDPRQRRWTALRGSMSTVPETDFRGWRDLEREANGRGSMDNGFRRDIRLQSKSDDLHRYPYATTNGQEPPPLPVRHPEPPNGATNRQRPPSLPPRPANGQLAPPLPQRPPSIPVPSKSNLDGSADALFTQTFHITLIRRDPSSGSQWNVGTISNDSLSPDSRAINVVITTPGYQKFTRELPQSLESLGLLRPGSRDSNGNGSSSSLHISVPKPPAGDSGTLFFNRQIHIQSTSTPRHYHRPQSSNDSTDSFSSYPNISPTKLTFPSPKPLRGNYSFLSPWNGTCAFTTGMNGRSLKCRHTLPTSTPNSSSSVTIAELRFNLPLFSSSSTSSTTSSSAISKIKTKTFSSSANGHVKRPFSSSSTTLIQDSDDEDDNDRLDLSLAHERAGGGRNGKAAKLGKLIIEDEGLKMLDLLVGGCMGVWWSYYYCKT